MTRDAVAEFFDRWLGAWRAHDLEALAALYAPNAVLEGPIAGALTGRGAIHSFFASLLQALPDLVFSDDQIVIDGGRAALFWTASGTHQGPLFGVSGSGRPVVIRCSALFTLSDAGIQYEIHRFDFTGVLLQAGLLKAKPA